MAGPFIGLCPFGEDCRVVWDNTFPTTRLGIYPATLLPTGRTTWHAAMDGVYPLDAPQVPITDFGLPFGGFLIPPGIGFGGLILGTAGTFTPDTEIILTFARIEYRLNVPHVLTDREAALKIPNPLDPNSLITNPDRGQIDVGEFVWHSVGVFDNPIHEEILNDLELLILSNEPDFTQRDREFQKLDKFWSGNSGLGNLSDLSRQYLTPEPIALNKLGIFYRLDNATEKSNRSMPKPGFFGGGTQASFNDGSSKILQFDLDQKIKLDASTARINLQKLGAFTPPILKEGDPLFDEDTNPLGGSLQHAPRAAKPGDTVYLTYVAIKEHYVRQVVRINWLVQAGGIQSCVTSTSKARVVNYRFYDWPTEPEGNNAPVTLHGWRAVESFNADVNFIAAVGEKPGDPNNLDIADFIIGGKSNIVTEQYLPAKVTISQLNDFVFKPDDNPLPTYRVAMDQVLGSGPKYHVNRGDGSADPFLAYRNTAWFQRNLFEVYGFQFDANRHVFFNVHPKALKKRDVDKWGIERFLALELEKDIRAGVATTAFPFMDDPDDDEPAGDLDDPYAPDGATQFLSSSNTKFEPFDPLRRYGTANTIASCGVTGTGLAIGGGDIIAQFAFGGVQIEERFAKDTKVLVEKFSHKGATGPINRLILLEGKVAPAAESVSCLIDPSKRFSFATHINDESHLSFNPFNNGYINQGMNEMEYRPDLNAPPIAENNNPTPDQFQPFLGYTGLLGDTPGYKEGKTVTTSNYSEDNLIKYKATDKEKAEEILQNVPVGEIDLIEFEQDENKIIIKVGTGFYGNTTIDYNLESKSITIKETFEALLIFKTSDLIDNIVDTIYIKPSYFKNQTKKSSRISIEHKWQKADVIELVGDRVNDIKVENILVTRLDDSIAHDFLNEETSSTIDEKPIVDGSFNNIFTKRSVLFETDIMSICEDQNSNLFIFFNDKNNGISCAATDDFGVQWHYHYGIVEAINGDPVRHPFVANNIASNKFYLFFLHRGKVYCKGIDYKLFLFEDAFIIEKFDKDILNSDTDPPTQNDSLYSENGRILRRVLVSWVVAGDLNNSDFLTLMGKEENSDDFNPNEERQTEGGFSLPPGDGGFPLPPDVTGGPSVIQVRKFPLGRGTTTAFTNHDVEDPFFSAYRKDNGDMRFFFMAPTQPDGDLELQCHFSTDNGLNWYSLWEFIEHGFDRLSYDTNTEQPFIGDGGDLEGTNPDAQGENAEFGINIHWSRMKRHKKAGGETLSSESQVLDISSPYLFYQPTLKKVFLFYVYEQCLLCKIFGDDIFDEAADLKEAGVVPSGMSRVKQLLERATRAYFIDGFINTDGLKEEIHDYINVDLKERMVEGNIIFVHQHAIATFNESRAVAAQRVCAYELPNGNVRIMYKHGRSKDLRAAIWTGTDWIVEDLMRNGLNLEAPFFGLDGLDTTDVTGGFGANAFGAGGGLEGNQDAEGGDGDIGLGGGG